MGARALMLMLLAACHGPEPRVVVARVTDSPQRGYVRVEALVQNGGGKGQVSLEIRLIDKHSGRTIQQERTLELEKREQVRLAEDVAAPEGDYRVEVTAEYPPE